MIWTKKFCGRLKSDLRYSNTLIYNNFPFCEETEENRKKISQTAEKILEVRRKYMFREEGEGNREEISEKKSNPSSKVPIPSLADLYDENLMPKDLREAHKKNDAAVIEAYGMKKNASEEEILKVLVEKYKSLTEK